MRARAPLALVMLVVACGKDPASSGTTTPAPSASARPAPAPSVSAAAPKVTTSRWTGTYSSAPGSLFVQDGGEWKGVHFRGEDASVALGEGPLSLTLDETTTLVRGEGGGALGDVILVGARTGDELTFTVARKNATDGGMTGTGVGKIQGDTVTGTMRLSRSDARVIREARFSLSRTRP